MTLTLPNIDRLFAQRGAGLATPPLAHFLARASRCARTPPTGAAA